MPFAELDCDRLVRLRDRGFAPACIYDVGASNGAWSEGMAEIFPECDFHLFEPLADHEPTYAACLRPLLANSPRWTLHKVCVGDARRAIDFHKSTASPFGSTGLHVSSCGGYFEAMRLPQVTLDDVIDETGAVPDFIKMDIQGCELSALRGCDYYLPQVQLLLLETWLSRSYNGKNPLMHEVVGYLAARGFFAIDFTDAYRDESGALIAQDVLFVNRASSVAAKFSILTSRSTLST